VTHPEGRKHNGMAPALKWFLVAAGVVLLLFFLFPLLRTTDKDFIDPPAAPASETVGAAGTGVRQVITARHRSR
jgi:hypothetical protein